jgi:hypothetical protein
MTAFECFSLWMAIKLHFTTDYDYIKYNGKTLVSEKSFSNRKDRFIFLSLSKKYTWEQLTYLFVFNYIETDSVWIGDYTTLEAESNYKKHQKIIESMSYIFERDCNLLFSGISNPNELLLVRGGNYPILLNKSLQKVIEIETLCILNNILKFLPDWNKKITDTVQWPSIYTKTLKLSSFLPKDMVKYELILKKILASQI